MKQSNCGCTLLFALMFAVISAASSAEQTNNVFSAQEQVRMQELISLIRKGTVNAALEIAEMMETKKRYKEAEHWYRHAFIRDNGRAGFALYHMYRQGHTRLEEPEILRRLSIHLMAQAAGRGDDSAALKLGLTYLKAEYIAADYARAVQYLELARKHGKAMASYHLGNIYSNGLFAPIQPRRALHYYEEASQGGVADATRQLGLSYLTGIYHEHDPARAIELLEKSIAQGSVEAMRDLANLYRYEKQDLPQYVHWMQKAASAGNSDAQYYMGLYLEAQDPPRARKYFLAAAEQNHLMARHKLPLSSVASQE